MLPDKKAIVVQFYLTNLRRLCQCHTMYTDRTRLEFEEQLAKLKKQHATLVDEFNRFNTTKHLLHIDDSMRQTSEYQCQMFELQERIEKLEMNLW